MRLFRNKIAGVKISNHFNAYFMDQELTFITRKIKLEFSNETATTTLNVEDIKASIGEEYELRQESPVSVSISEGGYAFVSFLVSKKQERRHIGFTR
jgi:hypothetical protein